VETLGSVGVTNAKRVRADNPLTNILTVTAQVILTFQGGRDPPAEVRLGLKTHGVMIYRESVQGYRCYGFDHVQGNCKFTDPRCRRCGEMGHRYAAPPKCNNCDGAHESTWSSCPVRLRRIEQLRQSASCRVERREALKTIPVCAPVSTIQPAATFSQR